MGRRKIEIQPITHERNRSVTFLKRKNGLFKKAYELGVLCSVDIAVIVFEERPGHHPKLYQYCSTDINELVQRHIRHQGEKDTRGPGDFANAPTGKFDEEEGDDDEPDDEEEYTPNRASKRRKVKKSSRNVGGDGDFEQGGMSIPQAPMPTMHGASSHPISSDRHALTDDPNAVASSYPPGFQPGAAGFRASYPFFPQGHPTGFIPPPGWDGRGDYARRPFDAAGAPAGAPYPIPPSVLSQQGPNGGPGNLFAFLEEQQRRAAAGAGIEWPDPAQAGTQSTAAPTTQVSGSEWLDFLSPRNANAASGGSNAAAPPAGNERSPTTAATAESWERGSAGSLPPKLRTGSGPTSKDGSDTHNEEKDEAAGEAIASSRGTKRAANGKTGKSDGKVKKEG